MWYSVTMGFNKGCGIYGAMSGGSTSDVVYIAAQRHMGTVILIQMMVLVLRQMEVVRSVVYHHIG